MSSFEDGDFVSHAEEQHGEIPTGNESPDLATRMQVEPGWLSQILSGADFAATKPAMDKVADALGCHFEEGQLIPNKPSTGDSPEN